MHHACVWVFQALPVAESPCIANGIELLPEAVVDAQLEEHACPEARLVVELFYEPELYVPWQIHAASSGNNVKFLDVVESLCDILV